MVVVDFSEIWRRRGKKIHRFLVDCRLIEIAGEFARLGRNPSGRIHGLATEFARSSERGHWPRRLGDGTVITGVAAANHLASVPSIRVHVSPPPITRKEFRLLPSY